MNAEAFYQRATALQKKGPLALFSGDLKLLMNEGRAAGAKARTNRLAAIAAHQKPRYCPPNGAVKMSNKDFMDGLSAIPQRDRARIDITEATTRILVRRFPCTH
jgi:hypothetical protein